MSKLGCMLTLATSPASKITFHRGEFFQMTNNTLLTTSNGSKWPEHPKIIRMPVMNLAASIYRYSCTRRAHRCIPQRQCNKDNKNHWQDKQNPTHRAETRDSSSSKSLADFYTLKFTVSHRTE